MAFRLRGKQNKDALEVMRFRILSLGVMVMAVVVLGRLFYWQVVAREALAGAAEAQHWSRSEIMSPRGKILSRDGYELVGNQPGFDVYVDKSLVELSANEFVYRVLPLLEVERPSDEELGIIEDEEELEASAESDLAEASESAEVLPSPTPTPELEIE